MSIASALVSRNAAKAGTISAGLCTSTICSSTPSALAVSASLFRGPSRRLAERHDDARPLTDQRAGETRQPVRVAFGEAAVYAYCLAINQAAGCERISKQRVPWFDSPCCIDAKHHHER